jgi:hypothetical protein
MPSLQRANSNTGVLQLLVDSAAILKITVLTVGIVKILTTDVSECNFSNAAISSKRLKLKLLILARKTITKPYLT